MKLTFLGAAHEVTGSCYLIEAAGKKILIDCGMEQGKDIYENQDIPYEPRELDVLLLTHSHIDHSGRVPMLYSRGFRGQIYLTKASCELAELMLKDSAKIQEFEAEWRNRKAKRSGQAKYVPLYTTQDVLGTAKLFNGIDYDEKKVIFDGIAIRFVDAGHLLGSASIEVWLTEDGITKKIVFSGDIGNTHQPIINDPHYIDTADYVVMESTYGDRTHGERPQYIKDFTKIIQETFDRGGNVVIPSFAVGRTQEILYFIRQIKSMNLIHGHNNFHVYLDSPLAIESTKIFSHNPDSFDVEAQGLLRDGINPLSFPGLNMSITPDESKAINFIRTPKVIISASGMCEAGRIRHHLKHNLWRPESTILFVGYQADGTLGRLILEGEKVVKLFDEEIAVKANIIQFQGISAHADRESLLSWARAISPSPTRFFITHGDDEITDNFAKLITSTIGTSATAPFSGESWNLKDNSLVVEGNKNRANKEHKKANKNRENVYDKLVADCETLLAFAKSKVGTANSYLRKLSESVTNLINKWK